MSEQATQLNGKEEAVTISGYGFKMVINGSDRPQIFNEKDEPVIDIAERMAAQEKLILPMIQKLNTSWNRELTELSAVTQKITTMSVDVKNTLSAINDNKPQKLQPGDRAEDTSYYMGVSESTGTDFYLFIESAGKNKTADVVTFNQGTQRLEEKHKNNEVFHGRKYSEFQLESNIIASYKNNTADGGNRRLTIKEWGQVEEVFKKKPELRAMALEVCSKDSWVQSASPCDCNGAWFQDLRDDTQVSYGRSSFASVLVGWSEFKPKL